MKDYVKIISNKNIFMTNIFVLSILKEIIHIIILIIDNKYICHKTY